MKQNRKWIRPLARMGYAARGLVYLVVGLFAILSAFGLGDKKDTREALRELFSQPFGTAIVWVLVAGLAGYVMWRLIQSLFDTDDHGNGPKGLAVRGGLLASAFTYGALGVYALSLLGVLAGGSGGSGSASGSIAESIATVVGSMVVSLTLAVVFAGVAIAHVWKAITQKYEDHFEATESEMRFIHPVSMTGLIARGLVIMIVSLLFLYRAIDRPGADERPGLAAALDFIHGLPMGWLLLAAAGAGLMAFSAYSFIESRWRRINIRDA